MILILSKCLGSQAAIVGTIRTDCCIFKCSPINFFCLLISFVLFVALTFFFSCSFCDRRQFCVFFFFILFFCRLYILTLSPNIYNDIVLSIDITHIPIKYSNSDHILVVVFCLRFHFRLILSSVFVYVFSKEIDTDRSK